MSLDCLLICHRKWGKFVDSRAIYETAKYEEVTVTQSAHHMIVTGEHIMWGILQAYSKSHSNIVESWGYLQKSLRRAKRM